MPLTPDEFRIRRDELRLAVLAFLKANDYTYSADEIVFELAQIGREENFDRVEEALRALVLTQRLEQTTSGSPVYYKYIRSIGFRPRRD